MGSIESSLEELLRWSSRRFWSTEVLAGEPEEEDLLTLQICFRPVQAS